jgi:hypothetical protein
VTAALDVPQTGQVTSGISESTPLQLLQNFELALFGQPQCGQ